MNKYTYLSDIIFRLKLYHFDLLFNNTYYMNTKWINQDRVYISNKFRFGTALLSDCIWYPYSEYSAININITNIKNHNLNFVNQSNRHQEFSFKFNELNKFLKQFKIIDNVETWDERLEKVLWSFI